MTVELALWVSGVPAPKYGDRPHSYTAVGAKAWAEAVGYALRIAAADAGWELVEAGPVYLECHLFMPRDITQPPDADKMLRLIGDSATGIVYRDDRQLTSVLLVEWPAIASTRGPGAALRFGTGAMYLLPPSWSVNALDAFGTRQ